MSFRRLGLWVCLGWAAAATTAAVACGGDDEAPARDRADAATDSTTPGTDPNATTDGAVDGGPDVRTGPTSTVTLAFERGATPVVLDAGDGGDGGVSVSPVVVIIDAREANGAPVSIAKLDVSVPAASGSVVGELELHAGGGYQVSVVPSQPSEELTVTVTAHALDGDRVARRTAIILPTIAAGWGQPEAVDGLVNTPGYEDGVVVSPDGEWLFVGSYSPVDVICCVTGCGSTPSPKSLACQHAIGPSAGPARPSMPGASRIVATNHIVNKCDKLCLTAPDGGELDGPALMPVGAYGFRRQADGSFTQPFLIAYDADGCGAPFGFSLTETPNGKDAKAVFAATLGATANDLYYAPLTLGSPNVLGKFACVGGVPQLTDHVAQPLALSSLAGDQGNPQFNAPYMFFDNDISASPPTMYVAKAGGDLPDAAFGPTTDLPVGDPAHDRRQPYLHEKTLYYADNLRVATAQLNGDPASPAAWTAPTIALSSGEEGQSRVGAIIALGQPTVAARGNKGRDEVYFVYGVRTATGVDMQAGRVLLP